MQDGSIRTVLRQIVGGAVIKPHPDGKDNVRVMHRHIGLKGAVHTQHTERLAVGGRESAEAHQRGSHRNIELLNQRPQLVFTAGVNRPAADVNHRFFRRHQRLQGTLNLPPMAAGGRVIRTHTDRLRPDVGQLIRRIEDIFW